MSRKADRRHALCLIFAKHFHEEAICLDETVDYYNKNFAKDITDSKIKEIDYVLRVFAGVDEHHEEIDGLIAKTSNSWDLSRISRLDLAVMRLAVYEMLHEADIAPSVSINEAVEIAKEFSSEEAGKFVNGILGKIVKNLDGKNDGN